MTVIVQQHEFMRGSVMAMTKFTAPTLDACFDVARTLAAGGLSATVACIRADGAVSGLACEWLQDSPWSKRILNCHSLAPQTATAIWRNEEAPLKLNLDTKTAAPQ